MKRHLVLIVGVVVVLGLAWVSFGQTGGSSGEGGRRSRGSRGRWGEQQKKAISAIEAQLAKIKAGAESLPARSGSWRELPEEERTKLREQFGKVRQDRVKSIGIIDDELAKLKGRRALDQEHEKSISQLNAVAELAKKEKATETAASIAKLIAGKTTAFEARMKKLELPQRRSRNRNREGGEGSGRGGNRGGGGRGGNRGGGGGGNR